MVFTAIDCTPSLVQWCHFASDIKFSCGLKNPAFYCLHLRVLIWRTFLFESQTVSYRNIDFECKQWFLDAALWRSQLVMNETIDLNCAYWMSCLRSSRNVLWSAVVADMQIKVLTILRCCLLVDVMDHGWRELNVEVTDNLWCAHTWVLLNILIEKTIGIEIIKITWPSDASMLFWPDD